MKPRDIAMDNLRRNMGAVKPQGSRAYIPPLPERDLSWLAGDLGPAERKAMREIAERADLETIDGCTFIVAPVSPETIDALAAFEAEGEDRENDLEDEPGQDIEPTFVPPTGFEVAAFGPIR